MRLSLSIRPAAFLATLSLAAALGIVAHGAPEAAAADCRTSTLSVRGTQQHSSTTTRVWATGGAPKVATVSKPAASVGTTKITLLACPDPITKAWKTRTQSVDIAVAGSNTLTISGGAPVAEGSFFFVTRVTGNAVYGRGYRCEKKWASRSDAVRNGFKQVLGLPMPGKNAVGVGTFIVEKIIPAGRKHSHCGSTEEFKMPFAYASGIAKFTTSGKKVQAKSVISKQNVLERHMDRSISYLTVKRTWRMQGL